jgi:hypothetical protein
LQTAVFLHAKYDGCDLKACDQHTSGCVKPDGVHGLRYDLPFLLTCLMAAFLCNCDGTEAVAQWCRDHVALLREVLDPHLFLTPSGSLYRWLLPQLDASAIERVLGAWVQATTRVAADEPLALDGKTVRGARSGEPEAGSRPFPTCWPS